MNDRKTMKSAFFSLLDGLADSVMDLSESEVLAEVLEDGEDPKTVAESLTQLLMKAEKRFSQRLLIEAKARDDKRKEEILKRTYVLPRTPQERRIHLMNILNKNPEMTATLLTIQNREFKDLTDYDVEGYLRMFQELGVDSEADKNDE